MLAEASIDYIEDCQRARELLAELEAEVPLCWISPQSVKAESWFV